AQRDYARAIADYDQAIRLNPQAAEAYNNRGDAYKNGPQHDYAHAIADYDQAIRLNPQYALAYSNRAQAYYAVQDYAHEVADYDQALRIEPSNAGWLNGRCWARAVWGQQLDQALADCDASLRIASEPNTLDSRGMVHFKRGEFQAALAD